MTQFDDWLRRLAAAGLLASNIPPAFRGLKWSQPVQIEGDWSTATLEGSVSLAPGSPAMAAFTISAPALADGWTSWTATLAAGSGTNSTGALVGDDDGDGIVELAAMFRLTPGGGSKDVLFGGALTVLEQA